MRSYRLVQGLALITPLLLAPAAHAETEAEFFKGKQILMIVGFPAGNEYDLGARLLARHYTRHIPGAPNIIVQNMPQAASIVAANYMATQAPRDGTAIGALTRNLVNQALFGHPNLVADPQKLIWLGSTSFPGRICVVGQKAPVKDVSEIFTKELVFGSVGPGNSTNTLPTVFNHVLGAKIKLIEGYRGTADVLLAIERDEVQGVCASNGQFRAVAQSFQTGKLRVLFRAEEAKMADFPDAPSIYDFAKTDEQRQFMRFVFASTEYGRPYVLPPEVPAARVATLRKALADAVADPELIAEADKAQVDMAWRSPEELERITAGLYRTPPDLIEAVKKLVPNLN
jgi:tripartite-type tricarboxylate transporter receptor subunit TctC